MLPLDLPSAVPADIRFAQSMKCLYHASPIELPRVHLPNRQR